VTYIRNKKNAYTAWWEATMERDHLEVLGVNGNTEMGFVEIGWIGVG
jgi:hypothetical protein